MSWCRHLSMWPLIKECFLSFLFFFNIFFNLKKNSKRSVVYLFSDRCSWTPYVRHVSGIDVAVKKGKFLQFSFLCFLDLNLNYFPFLVCIFLHSLPILL